MPKNGHRPQRTCLGCGARDDKQNLIRLAVTNQGDLKIEAIHGRGGYLHQHQKCWHAFLRRKGQYRAFRIEISRAHREKLVRQLESRE